MGKCIFGSSRGGSIGPTKGRDNIEPETKKKNKKKNEHNYKVE